MPIYEFRCNQCRRKSSHFFRGFSDTRPPACTNCGSADLVRVMSTFAVHQSFDPGPGFPSGETLGDFDEDDPSSTAEWVKGMRRDMGDSFGKEYDDMGDPDNAGDSPDF